MPRAFSASTRFFTSAVTRSAMIVPSIRSAVFDASASKFHRPRFANEHNLDLPRILQLRFYATRDFLGERCHADVIDLFRSDDDADFATGLNREHLVHALVARGDSLQTFEPLDVGL